MSVVVEKQFITTPTFRGVVVGAIALALSVFATGGNAGYGSGELGGNGGAPWKSPCRPNDVLVGIYIQHGNALDAVTAICSPLNAARTDWAGQNYQPTQVWGGKGGAPKQLRCQPGHAVHRLKASFGPWGDVDVVKGIGLLCADLDEAYYYDVVQGAKSTVTNNGEVKCKDGDWATGLYGNHGELVDKIGLLCDHVAAASTTPSSTSAPRPGELADGIDLPGSDIRNLITRNENSCQQACAIEQGCRAWTFVKNGSKCWLKNPVPAAVKSGCCVSGVNKPVGGMKKTPKPVDAGGGGVMTCTIVQSVDVCPTTDGCDEGTRIGVLTQGTVTVLGREGPWHKVRVPAGDGFAYSGEGYVSLQCPQ